MQICTCRHAPNTKLDIKTTQAPFWTLWTWKPCSIKKCTIWLGCRKVALCFVSVQGWALLFCLWMLSSCSSFPTPLPPLRQCSWDLPVHLFPYLLSCVIRSTRWDGGSPPVNYNPASSVYLCLHTLSLSWRHFIVKYAFFCHPQPRFCDLHRKDVWRISIIWYYSLLAWWRGCAIKDERDFAENCADKETAATGLEELLQSDELLMADRIWRPSQNQVKSRSAAVERG